MKPKTLHARHLPVLLVYAGIVLAAVHAPQWTAGYAAPVACLLLGALVFATLPAADLRPAATLSTRLLATTAILLGIALLHVARLPLSLSDPIWSETDEILNVAAGSVGVDRGAPLVAIGAIAAAALAFLLGLNLARDENGFLLLWLSLILASAVALVVRVGLFAVSFVLEGSSGFGPADFSPHADRQAAAGHYGLLTLAAFALFRYRYSRFRSDREVVRYALHTEGQPGARIVLAVLGAATLVFLAALVMTRSLEGQFATAVGLLLVSAIYAVKRAGTTQRLTGTWTTRVIALSAITIGLLALIVSRADASDLCRWTASLQAAAAGLVIGSGFGTSASMMELFVTGDCLARADVGTPYNAYLALIAAGGLISLAAVVYLGAVLVRTYVAGLGDRQRMRVFPITCLGIVAFLAVHAALADSLREPGVAVLAAALLGSGASVSLGRKRTSAPRLEAESVAASGDFSRSREFSGHSRGFQSE